MLAALIPGLVIGLVMYAMYSGNVETAVPLLVACVLVAFVLVIATFRVSAAGRGSLRKWDQYGVPPNRALHSLTHQQWMVLTVGLTVAAISTGALTGFRVLMHDPQGSAAGIPPSVAPAPIVTADPTIAAPPSPTPSPSPTPGRSSTSYLDSSPTIDGKYIAKPVTFSAVRYPRSLQFFCYTATSSYIQWNVAGSARFSATAGIDDSTTDTYGKIVELNFYDQDGRQLVAKPIEVSLGHPAEVEFPLTNVVGLRMTCAARDSKTNLATDTYAALGDAKVIY